jgi:hypothetical protein
MEVIVRGKCVFCVFEVWRLHGTLFKHKMYTDMRAHTELTVRVLWYDLLARKARSTATYVAQQKPNSNRANSHANLSN